jgi:aminoglycoside phosphotransferase (APT) family kinase protein
VALTLARYLRSRLGLKDVVFAEPPLLIPDGWEAYIYRFRLGPASSPPAALDRPLILRVYAGAGGLPRARREYAAQRRARRLGYPAPDPALLEEDCGWFGGPFLLMERVEGTTLLERLRSHPACILEVAERLARAHRRLHRLPPEGFAAPAGPFLERRLAALRQTIRAHDLRGLEAGRRWLEDHRPAGEGPPCVLHLDFHPGNLIAGGGPEGDAVLDWGEADVGDSHADVGTTLLLLRCAPVEGLNAFERLTAPLVRWALARRYLKTYAREAAPDGDRLRYYSAWACLRRLAVYGAWLREGPIGNGTKPNAVCHLTAGHLSRLRRYFALRTGTPLRAD